MRYTIAQMIRQRFLLYVALVFFLAISLKFGFRTVVAVTPVCGACHETRAEYTAWKKSSHADVACFDCHAEPGFAGYLGGPIRAARSIAVKFGGGQKPVVALIDDDNCLICHDTIMDDVVVKDGVKVAHRQIIDSSRRCSDCHAGVGHTVKGELSYAQYPSMDKCLPCHSSGRLKKCDLCHVKKPGRGLAEKSKMGFLAHDSAWGRGHGVAETRFCRVCHDKKSCGECHEIEMPHPPEWPVTHAKKTTAQNKCLSCHRPKFCDDCHILPMPHGENFDHGALAKKDRDTCDRCHTEKGCKDCHDLHDEHLLRQP